jgi:hypothetical protein
MKKIYIKILDTPILGVYNFTTISDTLKLRSHTNDDHVNMLVLYALIFKLMLNVSLSTTPVLR